MSAKVQFLSKVPNLNLLVQCQLCVYFSVSGDKRSLNMEEFYLFLYSYTLCIYIEKVVP